MSAGAVKDYRFASKNHWRRTTWNYIRKFRKPGPILCMPARDCLEIDIAEAKGFDKSELVAFERDPESAVEIRRRGVTVVPFEVPRAAVEYGVPFGGVSIDLCGSLNGPALALALMAQTINVVAPGAPFSINLLRGRSDSDTNRFFEQLRGLVPRGELKHRGRRWLFFVLMFACGALSVNEEAEELTYSPPVTDSQKRSFFSFHSAIKESVSLSTYRSGTLRYDSCRFRTPEHGHGSLFVRYEVERDGTSRVARSCAAIRAHRTRRRKSNETA